MKITTLLIITLLLIHTNKTGKAGLVLEKEVAIQAKYALALCKHLHRNPEISFQEEKTSTRMADELKSIGVEVTSNFAGNNVVGLFNE